jgi:hypothetical protein
MSKHSSLLELFDIDEYKRFITLRPSVNVLTLFFINNAVLTSKLEYSFPTNISN